mmetsp:Transcript_10444/g.16492  ORF Transcript_10444/g.16492 Transcript_10444/m.16492 type:complete len:184 (+) Transcript_10444:446-997(+)
MGQAVLRALQITTNGQEWMLQVRPSFWGVGQSKKRDALNTSRPLFQTANISHENIDDMTKLAMAFDQLGIDRYKEMAYEFFKIFPAVQQQMITDISACVDAGQYNAYVIPREMFKAVFKDFPMEEFLVGFGDETVSLSQKSDATFGKFPSKKKLICCVLTGYKLILHRWTWYALGLTEHRAEL